jgi:hypothetical protein
LHKIGTKSAKRKLKKISGRELPLKKDTSHVISKAIVSKAKDTARRIGMEDLNYIRFTFDNSSICYSSIPSVHLFLKKVVYKNMGYY